MAASRARPAWPRRPTAHRRSKISKGARRAARSSDSCSSRSSQNRWSGDWLRSRSTAGSTGASCADTSASSSGPNGITRAAASPPPRKTLMPRSRGHRLGRVEQDGLAHARQPGHEHGAAPAGQQASSWPRSASIWTCRPLSKPITISLPSHYRSPYTGWPLSRCRRASPWLKSLPAAPCSHPSVGSHDRHCGVTSLIRVMRRRPGSRSLPV